MLIVEDDDTIRSIIEKALKQDGYETIGVASSEEALKLVDKSFSLIITDIYRAGMNGLDFVWELRARRLRTPVVVLSGKLQSHTVSQFKKLGVFACLRKPFDLGHLRDVAERACHFSLPSIPTVFRTSEGEWVAVSDNTIH